MIIVTDAYGLGQPSRQVNMSQERINVLVAEDNSVIQRVAVVNLSRFPVNIVVAKNGQEAIDRFKETEFDLVLMDVAMPIKDGCEATRQIRAMEKSTGRHVPIIAITASLDRQSCIDCGMDDHISKPADYRRIIGKWFPNLIEGVSA
jgi:CheY-like chemotaxis protein